MKIKDNIRTVVTGIGPIASVGIGKEAFWNGLCQKDIGLKTVEASLGEERWEVFQKHKVDNFDIDQFQLDKAVLKEVMSWKGEDTDQDLYYLVAASSLALADSALEYDKAYNNIGLIVTHENPGLEQYFSKVLGSAFDYFQEQNTTSSPSQKDFYIHMLQRLMKSSYELQTFMPLFHVAKIFGLHGYSLFVNNACASGSFAMEEARLAIQSGKCEAVLVVGADHPDVYKYAWFKQLNMYAQDGKICPFSRKASGLVVGDGGAAIILESLEHAQKRSANIYAEYMGGSFISEAWKVTLPNIGQDYYRNAIYNALEGIDISPEQVDLLIPHGVGIPMTDKYEASIIGDVFPQDQPSPDIATLKPYFGHNLGGSVLLEVVALMMMFKNKMVLPVLNVEQEDLIAPLRFMTKIDTKRIQYALKMTCAFAGFDSAIIFKNFEVD